MKIEDIRTNMEALIFLFQNDYYFMKILNSVNLAGQYKKDNKIYYFNFTDIAGKKIKQYDNLTFYNMFARPCIYLINKGAQVDIIKHQYHLSDTDLEFLKTYGMAYYYVNRIVKQLDNSRKMIQNGLTYYAPIIIPSIYFPNIRVDEIKKIYKPTEILRIYRISKNSQ